ncbi:SURF1 family protein [Arthrobacter sp. H41]|uniref:SURF1 family protein n=1 Tax=Arthrobacter sp. H41 TaxID=1312978 RepID=UPI0004B86D59|nr:SURF1 family protein [Arthrobacter sp. H41]
MLKTALKPRWILLLILAMVIASVFVLLSQWQLSSSRSDGPPAPTTTESVQPLTDVLRPGVPLTAAAADQLVSFDGEFVPGTQLLVQDRVRGEDTGLWVVGAFEVEGSLVENEPAGAGDDDAADASDDAAVIPVVLGWVPAADAFDSLSLPEGPARVEGRLLPGEGPVAQRTVENQVPTLATAELTNIWDRPTYAAFVVSNEIRQADAVVPVEAPLETVEVGPQPQETPLNWLNIFYAIEWFVFAGFAFFLWWRLVADDYRRSLEDEDEGEGEGDGTSNDAEPDQPAPTAAEPSRMTSGSGTKSE